MCQYMAVAGAGAGARAKIIVKLGAGAENKSFRLRNTAFIYRYASWSIGTYALHRIQQ